MAWDCKPESHGRLEAEGVNEAHRAERGQQAFALLYSSGLCVVLL